MQNSYLSRLEGVYNKKSFGRKIDYLRYNFGSTIQKLKTKKGGAVLEVGPGKGEFLKYLHENHIKDIDIADNDKSVLKNLDKCFNLENTYHSRDIASIKDSLRQYDLIVLIQVLEHIPPKTHFSVIKTLYSKLKKGGLILVVVPNANNPLSSVERYGDIQHTTAFTEQSLKDLVYGSGINNYDFEIKGYSIPPYNLINIVRIILQKLLHLFLLILMIINGGTYFKTMTPNITLIISKSS